MSSDEPRKAWRPHVDNDKLNVMPAWCTYEALGRMPHGPLLAHAKMKGDEIVWHPSGQHLVPKERYDVLLEYPWEANGEDGIALIN